MNTNQIIEKALEVVQQEHEAIEKLKVQINDEFAQVVTLIHKSKGRVVVSGIGKSAIIAQKIAATMNSTGTPAIFMHAADAIHGDLGIIQADDVVIIISKSGESPEIKALLPLIKNFGNKVVALCGASSSFLATNADYFINCTVSAEACPNNLAPTTSTTAQLVMGDALAVCLLHLLGFSTQDFARFHPGGALGKKMYMTVGDLCSRNECPKVNADVSLKQVILEISSKRLGATAVLKNENLIGIITDGDLRRMLESETSFENLSAEQICNKSPKTIDIHELAVYALQKMRENNISQILVLDGANYVGVVHLHDLIQEGII